MPACRVRINRPITGGITLGLVWARRPANDNTAKTPRSRDPAAHGRPDARRDCTAAPLPAMTNPFRPHTADDARLREPALADDARPDADKTNPFQEALASEDKPDAPDPAAPPGVPRNPFQATRPAGGRSWKDARPRPASMANYRASRVLDVNSFKTLLMTGSVEPPEPVTKPLGDSSSSTESSSLSRHSIAESKEPALETPRSSYDASRDDEPLQRPPQSRDKTKPPPPPRSRHGKALPAGPPKAPPPKVPQTVSFDDFSPTIPESLPQIARRLDANISTLPAPSPSNPLPEDGSLPRKDPDALLSPRKTMPPPPPLARRSTVTKRPRRNTNSSINSQPDDQPGSYPPSIAETPTPQKMGPPPPPTRRTGSASIISPLTATAPSNPETVVIQGRARSTSQASLAGPAPPPPPARRQSSRASLESARGMAIEARRLSSEAVRTSIDSQRRVSLNEERKRPVDLGKGEADAKKEQAEPSKEQNVAPDAQQASTSGILADMEAFQKEIDELRARMT
jgi:hypothetical protein